MIRELEMQEALEVIGGDPHVYDDGSSGGGGSYSPPRPIVWLIPPITLPDGTTIGGVAQTPPTGTIGPTTPPCPIGQSRWGGIPSAPCY